MAVLPNPDNLWIYVALISGTLIVACLRIIGHAYHDAIRWHNLRVEVHRLKTEQQRRLAMLAGTGTDDAKERPPEAKRPIPIETGAAA